MKIGIDFDDVLGQSTHKYLEFINNTCGTNFEIKNLNNYGWWELLDEPRERYEKRVRDFLKGEYGQNIKPLEGALEVLDSLKKNNELYIITSRSDDVKKITEAWINKYFPNIFTEIYFTNQFELTGIKTTKGIICDNLKIDVFIDDNLGHVTDCARPNRKTLLLDYPWNQTDKLPEGVTRVFSWKEIGSKL